MKYFLFLASLMLIAPLANAYEQGRGEHTERCLPIEKDMNTYCPAQASKSICDEAASRCFNGCVFQKSNSQKCKKVALEAADACGPADSACRLKVITLCEEACKAVSY